MGLQVLDESQEYKTKVACQNLWDVAVLKSHANQTRTTTKFPFNFCSKSKLRNLPVTL